MRRRAIIGALLLIWVGVVLGGTVLRDQVASARSLAQSVIVSNPTSQPVPVHEQGTANVNVTNGSLSVGLSPVTSGGGSILVVVGEPQTVPVATASALTVAFIAGAQSVSLRYRDATVADTEGAVAAATGAPETVPLALTRPITFDHIVCFGVVGGYCEVNLVGNTP